MDRGLGVRRPRALLVLEEPPQPWAREFLETFAIAKLALR